MIGKKISHYKILEELGSGGMGVVYKAEDVKLKRMVALKFVVPRMLKKTEDKERFLREARTAASLNHPNICTIFQIDEVEDSTFIVMEYLEGRSLKEIIENGPLGLDKALDFVIQIARGLEEAQEKHIVHRDIKSSNIMVTPKAQVKIMDFGLAKMVSDVQLTETASIMGTVAYMSPEQACGETIDHRSDIWSLGVVLYEMLSGELPFHGDHEQLVLYSILNKLHKPVSGLQPGIPVAMERIVDKCLEKDPAERYQNAGELLADLRWLKKETESGIMPRTKPTWQRRKAKRIRKFAFPGILVFVALLVIGYLLFKPPIPEKISIAVLPIEDWSVAKDHEAECRSTTRALITKIAALSPDDLTVIPYNSILIQSRSGKDDMSIGRELNVQYILDSVLQSDGKNLLIKSDLVSVRENRLQKSFENTVSEAEETSIIDVQDNLSKEIVQELGVHLTESGLIAAKSGEPQNEDAYKWYIQGMYTVDLQDTYADSDLQAWFDSATRLFQNAINLDPDYALAYWGLGAAHEAYYIENNDPEGLKQTIFNWEKAYELDPSLAETNLGLGWAFFYKGDLDRASQMFKKALELNPESPLINCDVGSFLASIGLFYKAIDYYSTSIEFDAGYTRAYVSSAKCHWYIGEFATGARILEKALGFVPDDYLMRLEYASHLIMMGLLDKAEEELSLVEKYKPEDAGLVRSLLDVHVGETEKALAFVQKMDNKHHYMATCVYSLLGMNDETIEYIKRGIEVGFKEESRCLYCYLMLRNHPCYRPLHDDPRFIEILNGQKEQYDRFLKLCGDF